MPLHCHVEVGIELLARSQGIRQPRVGVRHVTRRTGRRSLRRHHVLVRRCKLRQRIAAAGAVQLARTHVRRPGRQEERPLVTVDLKAAASGLNRHARHLERDLGPALQTCRHGNAVRGIHRNAGARLLVAPLRDPRCDPRRQLHHFAKHEAQRVDRMAAGNRQWIGAVRAHALPDAARAPFQHRLRHHAQVGGQHLADVALRDQVTRVPDTRVAARLQPHGGAQPALARQVRHLLRLRERGAKRPLTEDGLPGAQACHHQLVVQRHSHRYHHEVNVRMLRHLINVVER